MSDLLLPPSFPARPMNGGRLESAEALVGDWRYRPKYNGRRILCHVPTLRTWNRNLEENTSSTRDKPAFKRLKEIVETGDVWPPVFEWMDLEYLWGKTKIGRGAIVVLDYLSANEVWAHRMTNLAMGFAEFESPLDIYRMPEPNGVYLAQSMEPEATLKCWVEMQALNKEWEATFYEGLVAYDIHAHYPIQLFSAVRETRHWIKYRFIT